MAWEVFSEFLPLLHKVKKSEKTFKKAIDKSTRLWYNITVVKNNANHLGV